MMTYLSAHSSVRTWHKNFTGSLRRLRDDKRGSIVVEFAAVSPVLILMLMGIIQFGAVIFVFNNMTNVARDTSRRAATGEFTELQAEAFAAGILVDWGIDYNVDVTVPDPDDSTARDVVTVITAPMEDAAVMDALGLLTGRTRT